MSQEKPGGKYDFSPAFSDHRELEITFMENLVRDYGATRRAAFTMLCRGSKEIDLIDDEAIDAMFELYESIKEYRKKIKAFSGFMASASARVLAVLENSVHQLEGAQQ